MVFEHLLWPSSISYFFYFLFIKFIQVTVVNIIIQVSPWPVWLGLASSPEQGVAGLISSWSMCLGHGFSPRNWLHIKQDGMKLGSFLNCFHPRVKHTLKDIISVGKDVEKLEALCISDGNVKYCDFISCRYKLEVELLDHIVVLFFY